MYDKTAEQALMFANRLQKRFRHLKKWALRTNTGAFRLYDRDIPEIPLVLDFYGNCDDLQNAALCGALYKRPYEKDEKEEEQWLTVMKESAATALGINQQHIFIKMRQKQKGVSQYEKISKTRFEKIVNESGLKFKVNLSDYLDTGLFPDRRLLREVIRKEANGKKVLNLFSYTGSFSVYAAAGGAASIDSVDLSNTYLNWAKDNFTLNGMQADIIQIWNFLEKKSRGGAKAQREENESFNLLVRADVIEFLEKSITAKMYWDMIILDPPAFSNSKKMIDTFDLNRDLIELVNKCLKLLLPGGKIYLSINLRRHVPTIAELETEFKNVKVTDLESKIIDEDFKGKKIPKAFLIEKS
ncbi:MAG: class I SAM-dependent methyltransferase [Treponema sp.]|nr:class I SAM-dependent methyltransferase [Treponema sp.]